MLGPETTSPLADFYHTGVVTTLHRLKPDSLERLETELEGFSRNKPIGLVLPALYSEFESPAMPGIISELRQVPYLQHIVVALGQATREQYSQALSFSSDFYTPVSMVCMDGERVRNLLRMLEERGLSAGEDGKGRSCWMAYGYLRAHADCSILALHDCDITNYERELLARLCYPVAHPHLGLEFCRVTMRELRITCMVVLLVSSCPSSPCYGEYEHHF